MRTIAVMTSGGDAPGMNAGVRAVVRAASGHQLNVRAIHRAFKGLVNGDIRDVGPRDVGGIIQRGGTILQTARFPEFAQPAMQREALRQINAHQIDGVIVIGGEGSMNGALALHKLGVPVMGIPASIDNDITGTDMCIGVDTALNTIVTSIDKLRDTASSHNRAFMIETMGRDCGYLALTAGIIVGAEVISIPESPASAEEIAHAVSEAYIRGKTHAIVVVAEGARPHPAELMADLEKMDLGFQFRLTILGHIQRGGSPTAADRLLAARFGVMAVERLLAGDRGRMVGTDGGALITVPLEEVCGQKRRASLDDYRMAQMLAK